MTVLFYNSPIGNRESPLHSLPSPWKPLGHRQPDNSEFYEENNLIW